MQITDLLRILRTRWRTIAVSACLTVVAAWVLLPDKLPQRGEQLTARATSTLVLENREDAAGNKQADVKELNTLAVIASEGKVPAEVATTLNTTVATLVPRVKITSSSATNSLSIVAVDRTKEGAAKIADTYSAVLLATLTSEARTRQAESRAALDQQVRKLEAAKAQLDEKFKVDPTVKTELEAVGKQLSNQRAKLTDLNAASPASAGLQSIGPATVRPLATARGADRLLQLPVRLGLAGLVGFAGSLAALVLIDRFDVRLRTKRAVELAYGLPVLAEVPVRRGRRPRGLIVVSGREDGAYVESHRILRTFILSCGPARAELPPGDPGRSSMIVVTSADPAEGKTSTAANLAASFSEAGNDTLVVGLDLRRRDLETAIRPGLRAEEVRLPPRADGTDVVHVSIRNTAIRNLRLVTVVPPLGPPSVVLPTVAAWLSDLRSQVDVIVVDTPPLLVCSDTSEIIPFADTVLVVCRAGRTTAEAAERTTEVLDRLHAPVCGVVLVGTAVRASVRKVDAYGGSIPSPSDGQDGDGGRDDPVRGLPARPPVAPLHPGLLGDDEEDAEQPGPASDLPAARQEHPPRATDTGRPTQPSRELAPLPGAATPANAATETAAWRPVAVPVDGGQASVRRTLSRAIERLTSRRNLRP